MKFVNRLSHADVKELVPFYHVYDFEETESPKPDTRLFKMRPTYGGPYEDVIIGDEYEMGTVCFYGVKKEAFIEFMTKKFGDEYTEFLRNNQ